MSNESGVINVKKVIQNLLESVQNEEEEGHNMENKRDKLKKEIENMRRELNELEMEQTKIEAEIMALTLRDKAYQKEHSHLRNTISIIKFQIEKVKERIETTKRNELENLKDFERAMDEITQKFRSSPAVYDRETLLKKIEEEKEKNKFLSQRIQETREAYASFRKLKGLRERKNEDEDLLSCALPGSELYYLNEMIKNLEKVISDLRKNTKDLEERDREDENLEATINTICSNIAAKSFDAEKEETENSEHCP